MRRKMYMNFNVIVRLIIIGFSGLVKSEDFCTKGDVGAGGKDMCTGGTLKSGLLVKGELYQQKVNTLKRWNQLNINENSFYIYIFLSLGLPFFKPFGASQTIFRIKFL